MTTERELIKEYLELKNKYNKVVAMINRLADKRKVDYRDDARYEHLKLMANQIKQAVQKKAKELKEVL